MLPQHSARQVAQRRHVLLGDLDGRLALKPIPTAREVQQDGGAAPARTFDRFMAESSAIQRQV
jgi:hypothetical protein